MERKFREGAPPLRRRHMGLAGAIIIVSQIITQYFSNHNSSKNISEEIKEIRADQEKYFVKKDELQSVSIKIDKIRNDLSEMDSKIRFIKRYVSNEEKEPKSKTLRVSNLTFENGTFK